MENAEKEEVEKSFRSNDAFSLKNPNAHHEICIQQQAR